MTEVDLGSRAYRKGLSTGDKIISASVDQTGFVLTIERQGKRYAVDLRTETANNAIVNSNVSMFSATANKMTMMPSISSNSLNGYAHNVGANLKALHPFTASEVAQLAGEGVINQCIK